MRMHLAAGLYGMALRVGDEPAAKRWAERSGCVPQATAVGPLAVHALSALRGPAPLAHDAPFPAEPYVPAAWYGDLDLGLYLQVLDAPRASYGIGNYMFAIAQLAQTTLRSEIGKIDLDKTFEERGTINQNVVAELDKASDPWGVKVLRYEIKNINPPQDVLGAMEKQMRAEREKRAVILTSEGERDAKINQAEGEKQRVIKESEAAKTQQINEAQGEAEAILAVATATAEGLRRVANAVIDDGGSEAMQLRIAEQYIGEFGNLAKQGNTYVVPANLADLTSMMALATDIAKNKIGRASAES